MSYLDIKNNAFFQAKVNTSTYNAITINSIANKYYSKVQDAVRAVNEGYFDRQYVTDYIFGVNSYALDPSWEKIKQFYVTENPKDKTAPQDYEYVQCPIIHAEQVSDPNYQFSGPTAIIYADYFTVYPFPVDSTLFPITNGLKIIATERLVPLVNDTDTTSTPPDYDDLISIGIAIDLARRQGNQSLLDDLKKEFKDGISEMKAGLSPRTPMESGIIEGQENYGFWNYPYGNSGRSF